MAEVIPYLITCFSTAMHGLEALLVGVCASGLLDLAIPRVGARARAKAQA